MQFASRSFSKILHAAILTPANERPPLTPTSFRTYRCASLVSRAQSAATPTVRRRRKPAFFATEAGASALNEEPRSTRRTRAPTSATPLSRQCLLLRGLRGPPRRAPAPASVVKNSRASKPEPIRVWNARSPRGNRPPRRRHRNRPGRQAHRPFLDRSASRPQPSNQLNPRPMSGPPARRRLRVNSVASSASANAT